MIVHVVLFEPRPELPDQERQQVFADLKRAADAIPSVRRFRIGRRVLHGRPGYEQAMRDDFSFAAVIEFDDRAGLESYLSHPAHEAIGRHFAMSARRALAYDYEMVDAAHADAAHMVNPQ